MTTPPTDPPSDLLPGDEGWVDDGRLWTAEELERLTPDQRAVLSRHRHQRNLTWDDLRPEFAEEARATARRLVAEHLRRNEADDT